jgi:hypothetical protein
VPAELRRVSHAEREAVADRLRVAAGEGRLDMEELSDRLEAAFAARTYADLVPLTHDLPDHQAGVPAPAATPATAHHRVGGRPGSRWSFALMSGSSRRGRWVVPETFTAVAVMGGVELDLRDALLEKRDVTIWCWAWMGGIDVKVPEDVAVDVSGMAFMGAFDEVSGSSTPSPDAPVVRIKGFALMGGVDVRRRRRRDRDA